MKNTSVRHALKSTSCDYRNEQEGTQKKSQGLLQGQAKNNCQEKENNPCLDTSISSVALEDSLWQQSRLEEYKQLNLLKPTLTLRQSCDRNSQKSQSTAISGTIAQSQNSISLQWDSLAQGHQTQELEQALSILHPHCGEKGLDASYLVNPNSVLSNNLKELSDEDFELFLEDLIWEAILGRLKQLRRKSLERDTKDLDYLSFPTLTSNANSTTRPAGQTKCEKWFKNKGLIPNGSQLGSQAIAMIMGFPQNWFDCLRQSDVQSTAKLSRACLSPTEPQEELEPDISQEEQLPQDKQLSPSVESSISIPCLVKQPNKQPFEGLIVGDRGSKFDVRVNDRIVQLSKLYVFPDLREKKKPQPNENLSPSKNSRRKKGTGSGYINWRDIRKNGSDYKETWYHYEFWDSGSRQVKSCVYIPKKMRSQIQKMNAEKAPVEEILKVLRNKSKGK